MNPNGQKNLLDGSRPAAPALRFFLGLIVFSFMLLGHAESTLSAQYAAIACGVAGYALTCRGSLVDGLHGYLASPYMATRWWLLLWMGVSLTWSIDQGGAVVRVLSMALVYLVSGVLFDAVRNHGLSRFILRMIFYASGLCAILTVVSVARIPVFERPASIFGNPNVIALISLLGLAVYIFDEETARDWRARLIRPALGLSLFAATFMSSSRKGFLGIVILCLIALFHRSARRRLFVAAVVAVPIIVLGFSVSSVFEARSTLTAAHLEKLTQIGEDGIESDRSFSERADFLAIGLEKFIESPVIGYGMNSFPSFVGVDTYSHNNYVEIAVSLGAVGVLLYYAFYVHLLLASIQRSRNTVEGGVIVVFLVLALVLDVGFVSYLFKPWILFSVLAAGHLSRRKTSPWIAPETQPRAEES